MNCFEKFLLDGDSIIRTVIENVDLALVDSITDCSSNLVYWRYLLWLNAAYPRDHVWRSCWPRPASKSRNMERRVVFRERTRQI